MNMTTSLTTFLRVFIIILAIGVAGYAVLYLRFEKMNLMYSKTDELLNNLLWKSMFYTHITFGAIALAVGGFQFFPALRHKFINTHRKLGIIYVFSVLLSGLAGFYIAFFASTGTMASIGFGSLAVFWLYTNWKAYQSIKNKQVVVHQQFMVRNYALTLAAVTLRIYLGIFIGWQKIPFNEAYPFIAWGAWLPNLLVAEMLIRFVPSSFKQRL